jgi:hypothetical protein
MDLGKRQQSIRLYAGEPMKGLSPSRHSAKRRLPVGSNKLHIVTRLRHREGDRRRSPDQIFERFPSARGCIRQRTRVQQECERVMSRALKLPDHQGAAPSSTAPVYVAQAIAVAKLSHAGDL